MATSKSVNQTFDLSAASGLTSLSEIEALIKQIENADPSNPKPQSAPSKSEQTTPPSTASTSAAPVSTDPDATQATPAQPPPPAEPLTAVASCSNAYNQAYKQAKDKKHSDYDCRKDAERAYINRIPGLHNPENINDFIACVAYAMLTHIISPSEGTKILYAAQIAMQANQATKSNNKIANRNKSTPDK